MRHGTEVTKHEIAVSTSRESGNVKRSGGTGGSERVPSAYSILRLSKESEEFQMLFGADLSPITMTDPMSSAMLDDTTRQ